MKVISISTDRKIFEEGSAVRARQAEYGTLFGEMHIIVFAERSLGFPARIQIAENVFVYPTNSRSRFFYVFDAMRLGERVAKDWDKTQGKYAITTQDPFETGKAGVALAKKLSLPLNIQIHTDFLSPYFRRSSFRNFLRASFAGYALLRARSIRVVSERIRASVIRKWPMLASKVIVLPIWTDVRKIREAPPRFSLKEEYPQFEKIILMMSRLEKEKDIPTALRAFAKAVEKFPKTGLVIVGSGSLASALQQEAASLGILDKAIFRPWTEDAASCYKSADIFLSASRFEGYGLTLVEAAAAGIPIVTTDAGIAGEFLVHEKNALIAPVGDIAAIAGNLESLLGNPGKAAALAAAAASAAEAFVGTKENFLHSYRNLFSK